LDKNHSNGGVVVVSVPLLVKKKGIKLTGERC
jgi:hypothetical protein